MIATRLSKASSAAWRKVKTPAALIAEEFGILHKNGIWVAPTTPVPTRIVAGLSPFVQNKTLAGEVLPQKDTDGKSSTRTSEAPPHHLTGVSSISEKTLAAKVLLGNHKAGNLAGPTARVPYRLFAGGLSSARFGFHIPGRAVAPRAILSSQRMFSSSSSEGGSGPGHRLVDLRVKSIRPRNCLGDELLSLEEGFRKYPLFREIRNHPLIPNSAKAWLITKHGLAFFHSLGLFAYYNNEFNISIAPSLNEENIKMSSRFSCAEFVEGAQGFEFDGKFHRGKSFASLGEFARYIVEKYYAGANIPPEVMAYIEELIDAPDDPSRDHEEFLVFNAALLSSASCISYIYRSDSWLRRKSKDSLRRSTGKKNRSQDYADSRDMLYAYADKVVGDKGERIGDLISVCPMMMQSKKIKQQWKAQNPNNQSQQHKKKRKRKSKKQLQALIGEENLAAQRDLFVHGFDEIMLKDPVVVSLIQKPYTSEHLAEYERWYLRKSNIVLQKIFLMQGRHSVLNMWSLFQVDRVGNFRPKPPVHSLRTTGPKK